MRATNRMLPPNHTAPIRAATVRERGDLPRSTQNFTQVIDSSSLNEGRPSRRLISALAASLLSIAALCAASPELRLADATQKMDRAAVRALLDRHASVNEPQADGTTALHWAAEQDDLETARLLIAA